MSTSEWPQMDTSAVEISPGTEASSDLFGGDLFGDELLDMYHSAVVGNGVNDGVDSVPNDVLTPVLPNLMSRTKDGSDGTDHNLPNPITSSDYDGLAAFRPSTSMNDFTNLLENTTASSIPAPTPLPMLQTKPSDPIPVHTAGGDGAISGQSKKRPNAECNAITDMSLSHPPNLSHANKKRAICTEKGNVNVSTGQFTNDAVLNKIKADNISPGIHNDGQNTPAGNSMHKNTPDPFSMNMMRGGGTMNNMSSLGAVNVTSNTNITTSKVGPLSSTPGISTIPIPPPTLKGKTMANSSQLMPVNQSGVAKNIISSPQPVTIKTEESFKVVAQAAVTNLILSAGSNPPRFDLGHNVTDSDSDSSQHLKPVNTTSSHVAALTSNNWVAACAASINNAPPGTVAAAQAAALAAASDPAAAKAARARRATLTADERARQNRDRNREHARNTRLRKKAYVEELKRTLTELVAQRDAQDLEKRHEKQRDLEVREVRYRVMEEFLKLRARGSDVNLLARWVAILEDGFTLTLPKTEYRTMVENHSSGMKRQVPLDSGSNVKTEVCAPGQVLRGATECLEDASKVASFINTLGSNNSHSNNLVTMAYLCDRKNFMMDGVNATLDWSGSTSGATSQGAISELSVNGYMRATFSPASNKLICAELLFDTGGISSFLDTSVHNQQVNQSTNGNTTNNSCTAETDALLDSVLPPVTSEVNGMSSNVTIISYEKGDSSSDEDYNAQPN